MFFYFLFPLSILLVSCGGDNKQDTLEPSKKPELIEEKDKPLRLKLPSKNGDIIIEGDCLLNKYTLDLENPNNTLNEIFGQSYSTCTVTYPKDKLPPNVSITQVHAGELKTNIVFIIDESFSLTVRCDGVVMQTTSTKMSDSTFDILLANLPSGEYNHCNLDIKDFSENKVSVKVPSFTVLPDTTAPTIIEIKPIGLIDVNEAILSVDISEEGSVSWEGACSSNTLTVAAGKQDIKLSPLEEGIYNNCTLFVTDIHGNQSTALIITPFTIEICDNCKGSFQVDVHSYESARDIAIQADGKFLVLGDGRTYYNQNLILVRFNTNGLKDQDFGYDGVKEFNLGSDMDFAHKVLVQPDGKIIVAGRTKEDLVILRLNEDGSFDNTFNQGSVTIDISYPDVASDLLLQDDGKIVITGSSGGKLTLIRLNKDGTLDNTFGIQGSSRVIEPDYYSWGHSIAVDASGHFYVAGNTLEHISLSSGGVRNKNSAFIVKFMPNGQIDTSFAENGLFKTNDTYNSALYSIVILPNGNLLAGGTSSSSGILVNLTSDGQEAADLHSLNDQYLPKVYDILLIEDNKILLSGIQSNSLTLYRLNGNGSRDAIYGESLGSTHYYLSGIDASAKSKSALQKNGKLLMVSTAKNNFIIARFNEDGTPESNPFGPDKIITGN